jgi:hypothetical protein
MPSIQNLTDFDCLELTITNNSITSYVDVLTGFNLKSFHQRLTAKEVSKLYIIKEDKEYLYVGTTMQSIKSRMRYGLKADGKRGYHGYKWKTKEKIRLYVWRFDGLSKHEIENIEAELVFLIRQKTGQWPLSQNEIHFNNLYQDGQLLAEELYKALSQ